MSNSSDNSEHNKSSPRNGRWALIKSELSTATDAWESLEKNESRLSPDEEQLVKIKSIIGQLRDKLEQF